MKKHFKWLAKDGRIFMLRRSVGLFGEQWECFGNFDDKDGNAARSRQIIKQLNQCAQHTENYNGHD